MKWQLLLIAPLAAACSEDSGGGQDDGISGAGTGGSAGSTGGTINIGGSGGGCTAGSNGTGGSNSGVGLAQGDCTVTIEFSDGCPSETVRYEFGGSRMNCCADVCSKSEGHLLDEGCTDG